MAEHVTHTTETRRAGLGCFGVIVVLVGVFFIIKGQREQLDERIDALEEQVAQLETKLDRQRAVLDGIALEVGSVVEVGEPVGAE
ncbi:MAG: hypothetical protein ED559_06785 [Phycisphaera sp.]|nr:MAG: hypothetical protein ED559_06785 [Phycisphaera sp.]